MSKNVGVWIIGARGAIGTVMLAAHWWMTEESGPRLGMVTETAAYRRLKLKPLEKLVLGGCDVATTTVSENVDRARAEGVLPIGFPQPPSSVLSGLEEELVLLSSRPVNGAAEILHNVRQAIASFRERHGLERVIVVNCATTWPLSEDDQALMASQDWTTMEQLLCSRRDVPWAMVYTAAAFLEGCAYVNFTPNPGAELPALAALALKMGVPHAGKDGKTGETLIKSVLAPLFRDRALRVLSWQGYNMLGNSDGKSLQEPGAKALKVESKDRQLRAILPAEDPLHTAVRIDYVPSLGDWKTAWDFIHFEGFLGARMAMQFTWQGCDTVLAVPLVFDLVRLVELSWRNGESGALEHLCSFFKSPIGCDEHEFSRQVAHLHRHLFGDIDLERLA